MTTHGHAFEDSQQPRGLTVPRDSFGDGNRSEESQNAADGLIGMYNMQRPPRSRQISENALPSVVEGPSNDIRDSMLSTQSQTCERPRPRSPLKASPGRASSHRRENSGASMPRSSGADIEKDLIAKPPPTLNRPGTRFSELEDKDSPPAPPSSSGPQDDSQWARINHDDTGFTQGPLRNFAGANQRASNKLPVPTASASASAPSSGPSTSTPRKDGVALPIPDPTPADKRSTLLLSGPRVPTSEAGSTPPRSAGPAANVDDDAATPPRTAPSQTVQLRPSSATRSNAQQPAAGGFLHMPDAPLSREASRQRIQEGKSPKKKKSNDTAFPESSSEEESMAGRAYQLHSNSKWGGAEEQSRTSDKENLSNISGRSMISANKSAREADSTAETTLRSPAKSATKAGRAASQLAVPAGAGGFPSSSSHGTQDMSLQIGTAPSIRFSAMPAGTGRAHVTQTGTNHYRVTPPLEESQEADELADDDEQDMQEEQQQVVPSTSEADLPAEPSFTSQVDLDDTDGSGRFPLASQSRIQQEQPSETVRDLMAGKMPVEQATSSASSRAQSVLQIASSRVHARESAAMSFTNSATSASASNGRGVDPPAGRSLQRGSRPASLAQIPANQPIETDTQTRSPQSQTQTQKIPTSDAPTEHTDKHVEEGRASSPASEEEGRTRLVPDSQHAAGRTGEDRTFAESEADILMDDVQDPPTGAEEAEQAVETESSTSRVTESTPASTTKVVKGKQRAAPQPAETEESAAEPAVEKAKVSAKKRKVDEPAPAPAAKRNKTGGRRVIEQSASEAEQSQSISAAESSSRSRSSRLAPQVAAIDKAPNETFEVAAAINATTTSKSKKGKGRAVNFAEPEASIASTSEQSSSTRPVAGKGKVAPSFAKAGAGPASKTGRKASTAATVSYEASQSSKSSGSARAKTVISTLESMPTEAGTSQPAEMDVDEVEASDNDDEQEQGDEEDESEQTGTAKREGIRDCVQRVYIRLEKFYFPGVLTLAESGDQPFRVQLDDTSYADLHVNQLSQKLVKCMLQAGDVVVRASDAGGVKKSRAKQHYEVVRVIEAGTPENRKGKTVPFGQELDQEDLVVVKQVSGGSVKEEQESEQHERWLVEATCLLPTSAAANNERKLSPEEIDAIEGALGQPTSRASSSRRSSSERSSSRASTSTSVSNSTRASSVASSSRRSRSETPRAASVTPAALSTRSIPAKLFATFGLIFTSGHDLGSVVEGAKHHAKMGGATLVEDVSELFSTDDLDAESQTDTRLTFDADSQQAGLETILLLALEPVATPKYLKALALGVPCVSVSWVNACITAGEPVAWKPFALGSGRPERSRCHVLGLQAYIVSHESFSLSSIASRQSELHIFSGHAICFLSGTDGQSALRAEMARDWLTCLGADKVLSAKIANPPAAKEIDKYSLVISDQVAAAKKKLGRGTEVSSWEWLKSCVIAGRVLEADA